MESKQKTEYKDGPCWTLLQSGEWKRWPDVLYKTESEYCFYVCCGDSFESVKYDDIKSIYPCDEHGFIEADLYQPTESDDYLTRCCVNPPQVRFKSPNGGRQELIHDGKYFSVAVESDERKK